MRNGAGNWRGGSYTCKYLGDSGLQKYPDVH